MFGPPPERQSTVSSQASVNSQATMARNTSFYFDREALKRAQHGDGAPRGGRVSDYADPRTHGTHVAKRSRVLDDWQSRRLMGCFRAKNVLTRGRFVQLALLRFTSLTLLAMYAVIVMVIKPDHDTPGRNALVCLAVAALLICQAIAVLCSLTSILFNLIEFRATSHVAFDTICRACGVRRTRSNLQLSRAWAALRNSHFRGRGAYIPKSPITVFSDLFHGFPPGTFMISYCWAPRGDSELPRKVALEMLPEKLPSQPQKCWIDIEQLLPGTDSLEEMVRADHMHRGSLPTCTAAHAQTIQYISVLSLSLSLCLTMAACVSRCA